MFILLLISCALLIAIAVWAINNTIFDFSIKRRTLAGILLYQEIFALVVPGVLLIAYFGPSNFNTTANVTDNSVFPISFLIIFCLIVFFISVKVFTILLHIPSPRIIISENLSSKKNIVVFTRFLAIFGMALSIFFMLFFGVRHAFITSILTEQSLLLVRLDNTYATGVPSMLISLSNIINILIAILIASPAFDKRRVEKIIIFVILMLFASMFGAKSPILSSIILYVVSYGSFHRIRISPSVYTKTAIGIISFISILFIIVHIQTPEYSGTDFAQFIVERLGIGQIAGTYEEFNIQLQNPEYIWHAVPFARLFKHYPIFQKDLMLVSENVYDFTKTGVKSSLFLSEAFAMGGLFMAFLSPVVVAFSLVVSCKLLYTFLHKTIFSKYDASKISPLITLSFLHLTGDFSAWFMLKGVIMLLIFISTLYTLFWITAAIFKINIKPNNTHRITSF